MAFIESDPANSVLFSKSIQMPCCATCGYALDNIFRHFREKHKTSVEKATSFQKYAEKFAYDRERSSLCARYHKDPIPGPNGKPLPQVEHLEVAYGISCPICRRYLPRSGCRAHIRKDHGIKNEQMEEILRELAKIPDIAIQTIRKGKKTFYFPVAGASNETQQKSINGTILDDFIPSSHGITLRQISDYIFQRQRNYVPNRPLIALEDETKSALVTELGIEEFLRSTELSLEGAYAISTMDEETMKQLQKHICKYFDNFRNLKPSIPMNVREIVKIKDVKSKVKFNLHIKRETCQKYARHIARFLVTIFNVDSALVNPFPVCALGALAKKAFTEATSSSNDGTAALHEFLNRLLLVEVKSSVGERVILEDVFKLICASYAMCQNGRYRCAYADDASHLLAALQYTLHMAAIGEFLEYPIGFGERRDTATDEEAIQCMAKLTDARRSTAAAVIRYYLSRTLSIQAAEVPKVSFTPIGTKSNPGGAINNVRVFLNSDDELSLRHAIVKIQDSAYKLLHVELMKDFALPDGFWEKVSHLQDNVLIKDSGYYFGEHPKNINFVRGLLSQFLKHLSDSHTGPLRFFSSPTGEHKFEAKECSSQWLSASELLAKKLFVLINITCGGPPRGTEQCNLRMRNNETGRRSFFMHDGSLIMLTTYSKTQSTLKPKPIARLVDRRTAEILFLYIVLISFVAGILLESNFKTQSAVEDFLFSEKGQTISPKDLRAFFLKEMTSIGCIPFDISTFRQFQVGLAKSWIAEELRNFFIIDEAEHLQAGHSAQTATTCYANIESDFSQLTPSVLCAYKKVSFLYHKMVGLQPGCFREAEKQQKQNEAILSEETGTSGCIELIKRIDQKVEMILTSGLGSRSTPGGNNEVITGKDPKLPGSVSAIDELKTLYSITAEFKSVEQRTATSTVLGLLKVRDFRCSILIIMPTGGGKTLSWMLPARVEQNTAQTKSQPTRVTVLVLPLMALKTEMRGRCERAGLNVAFWDERYVAGASVIVVDIHVVSTSEYVQFVSHAWQSGQLAMIVIDEIHLLEEWDFRGFGFISSNLRPPGVKCPLIGMSATLPGTLQNAVMKKVGMTPGSCLKVRASTRRRNIRYEVQRCADVFQEATKYVIDACKTLEGCERIIAYCLTRKDVRTLKEQLDGQLNTSYLSVYEYHGNMDTTQRTLNMQSWVSDKNATVMVATSAFGCGIDCEKVRFTVHVGGARNLLSLAQESGRVGRDDKKSTSIVFYNEEFYKNRISGSNTCRENSVHFVPAINSQDVRALFGDFEEWVNASGCRKRHLQNFLDDGGASVCSSTENKCDICDGTRPAKAKETVAQALNTENILLDCSVRRGGFGLRTSTEFSENSTRPKTTSLTVLGKRLLSEVTPSNSYSDSEDILSLARDLKTLKCAVCLVAGHSPFLRSSHKTCFERLCFRCLRRTENSFDHPSKTCNVMPKGNRRDPRCYSCGLHWGLNLHDKTNFGVWDLCPFKIVKDIAFLKWWRNGERQKLLLMLGFEDQKHSIYYDINEFGRHLSAGLLLKCTTMFHEIYHKNSDFSTGREQQRNGY